MILGNRGYNAYEVNKKMKGIRYEWENQMAWISYQVWIANGIEEVSSVLVYFKLISSPNIRRLMILMRFISFSDYLLATDLEKEKKILINYSKRMR